MHSLPHTFLSLALTLLSALCVVRASSTTRNPISAITTVQNATIHTFNHRITALSSFDLTFNLQDEVDVKFHLEPNHDILADSAYISYLAPDGTIRHSETVDRLEHKIYKGSAWVQQSVGSAIDDWRRVGWARISIVEDGREPVFEGAFSVDFDSHHIQTAYNYARTRHPDDPTPLDNKALVLWRDSDIMSDHEVHSQYADLRRTARPEPVCQADGLSFNTQLDHPVYVAMRKRSDTIGFMDFSHLFSKRQTDVTTSGNGAGVNLVSTIGQTSGCPSTRKVALVGVATDCTYTASFNSTQTARENVISQLNQASQIWESAFNISLGLANLTISDATCPGTPAQSSLWNQDCSNATVDISERLNLFSAWRGNQADNNSHWTLLSTCNTGSAVGLAWLGQACVQSAVTTSTASTGNGTTGDTETVSGANVVIRTEAASEWQIIAHETGHTYGAVHDCTSTTCADANTVNSQQCCPLSSSSCDALGQYIMNPSTGSGISTFSPCSIGNICSAIGRNSVKTTCLSNNKEVTTISGQQCGNGIVEPGEDCDCGGTAGCGDDKCCDPTTCKFTTGSVCDDANEDCCRGCQLATNGTVCRSSTGSCDPAEVCTGTSATCPPDLTAPNGESCGDDLQCASGHCTSRDEQCKTVMGSYTQGNDTYACDSSSCVITCASPEFGAGVCYGLQQNFLDGTPCGGGGTCQNGQCEGTSTGGEITSWINDHKNLIIYICAAIGGLLLIIIMFCISRHCCRRNRPQRKPGVGPGPNGGWQGWNGDSRSLQQPEMSSPGYHNPQHPSQACFNQASGGNIPAEPPPAYNKRSVRYA